MEKLQHLLKARNLGDIDSAIASLPENNIAWAAVGNIDNNTAIINIGSDPAAGVTERITNAIDAIIDRTWLEQGQPENIKSPRIASAQWFNIPGGRLAEIKANKISSYEETARKIELCLHDSGQDTLPTIDIRDLGTGLLAEEFSESILGLNKDRKLKKLFLAGAFGQGGSTAIAYSRHTIIASRAMSQQGISNPVAITVVTHDPGNPEVDKHGYFKYLIDPATGNPFILDMSEAEFPAGTLVRHIAMDLGKYSGKMTAATKSLRYLSNHYLFDPVLPFTIRDRRAKSRNANSNPVFTILGNNWLLSQSDNTEYKNSSEQDFHSGKVTISWWLLTARGEKSKERIKSFTLMSQPIIVTFNGQKQGYFPNTVIKSDLKLPYLDSYLVVQVDCDKLDAESRRQLFSSTRESIKDTAIGDELRKLITETLAGDENLKRLDYQRMKKLVTNVESSYVDRIRKRLASRVKVYTQTGKGNTSPIISPSGDNTILPKKAPIAVRNPPTFLKIIHADPRRIYAGRKFTLGFETDAAADYFRSLDTSFSAVTDPPGFAQYTGITRVIDGYGTAYFQAADELEEGNTAVTKIELRIPGIVTIGDSIATRIIPLPMGGGNGSGNRKTPNINPIYVDHGDSFWREHNWDEETVAEVLQGSQAMDVYISGGNKRLRKLLSKAQRQGGKEALNAIKDFYIEHTVFHAVISHLNREQAEQSGEVSDQADEEFARELNNANQTICGIITELFDVLVIATQDSP